MIGNTTKHIEDKLTPVSRDEELLDNSVVVSFGQSISRPSELERVPLWTISNDIKNGKYSEPIDSIRGSNECYKKKDKNGKYCFIPELRQEMLQTMKHIKNQLPYFVMATFSKRRCTDCLVSITGLVIDIDHVDEPEDLQNEVRDRVMDAHFIFRSPTDGVKIVFVFKKPMVVMGDNLARIVADYKFIYNSVAERISKELNVTVDSQCHDPVRACFVSYDRKAIKRNAYLDGEAILAERKEDVGIGVSPVLKAGQTDKSAYATGDTALECYATDDTGRDAYATDDVGTGLAPVRFEHEHDDPELEFEKARAMVTKLAQIRIAYKDFIKVGMALYSGFGERGKELWMLFKDNPNYNDSIGYMETHWRSFRANRTVKLASLYYVGGIYGLK
jgi:hypothetical protein